MVIFYKGEDIIIHFKSVSDISDYTKVVKVFTPFSSPITATINEIDDFNFTATISDTQSSGLKTGTLNIVLEFSLGGNTIISKSVECQLNDAYLNGGARESTSQNDFSVSFNEVSLNVSFESANYGAILEVTQARDEAVQAKDEAVQAKDEAQAILDAIDNLENIGILNASTGVATIETGTVTLSATPPTGWINGQEVTVTLSGAIGFAGINFTSGTVINIGDKLRKRGAYWELVPFAVGDGTITEEKIAEKSVTPEKTTFIAEIVEGIFRIRDLEGNILFQIDNSLIVKKISTEEVTLEEVVLRKTENGEFFLSDLQGNYILKIGLLTGLESKKISTEEVTIDDMVLKKTENYQLIVKDRNGNYVFKLDDFGIENGNDSTTNTTQNIENTFVLSYGQSNSAGEGLIESPDFTAYDSAKMFKSGLRAIEGSIRESFANVQNVLREFPDVSFANYFKTLKNSVGLDNNLLIANCGQGGQTVQALQKGSTYYNRLLVSVTNAKAISLLSNSKLTVASISYNQGESNINYTQENFKNYTVQLMNDVNSDLKSITKQNQTIFFNTVQTAYSTSQANAENVALWQKELMLENNNYLIACPTYMLEYDIEGVQAIHYSENSRRIVGAYQAKAFFQTYVQKRKFQPLRICTTQKRGNTLVIFYDRNIQLDTSASGFVAVNSSNAAVNILATRCIANTIELDFSDITTVQKIRYARTYQAFETISSTKAKLGTGLRGTVRDFEGENFQFNGFKLDNYAIAEIITI